MRFFICLTLVLAALSAGAATPKVHYAAHNGTNAEGNAAYIQSFIIDRVPEGAVGFAFNQFARRMKPVNPADSLREIVPGYYAVYSSRMIAGQPLQIDLEVRGVLNAVCYEPDGFHFVLANGTTLGAETSRFDILSDPEAAKKMPSAQSVWERNEQLAADSAPGVYDFIPSFKEVKTGSSQSDVNLSQINFKAYHNPENPEFYRITIADGKITVEADPHQHTRLAKVIAHRLGTGTRTLPDAVITDWPDVPYRGLMVDVVRNFQSADEIVKVLDLMALYGLNTLHFHLTDDEAWRVEIEGLPELTAHGSRRGYFDNEDTAGYLPQIFAGDGNPDSQAGTANGFYTRADMLRIIRHADSLGIAVIPEIESPGHGRAAIRALRNHPQLRLHDLADTSVYTSAQSFHDNVMNPALEGPYLLLDTVAATLASIWAEAGAELPAIHIGGDEVPRNAWAGSPAVNMLKDSLNLTSDKAVHAHFVRRVADNMARRGIKISGWQEIALKHPEEYNEHVRPYVYSVNCWSTLGSHGNSTVTNDITSAGYPAVLSNVDHFYLDMCYSPHPMERGLSWGGYVDEFDALDGYPAALVNTANGNIKGIQGQVFAETLRGPEHLEVMMLPKMLGLAERAWNNDSTYTHARFNTLLNKEIPSWNKIGAAYHVRQPGLKAEGKRGFSVNSSYPEPVIRYTLDGSEPTLDSPAATPGSIVKVPRGTRQVRARQWVGDRASVTTVLNLR